MVEIKDEVEVLQLCQNKFVVAFKGVCSTPDARGRIWILMDYYSMGSILNLTWKCGLRLNESQISYVVHSVLMGLVYLNSRNICHRDVKGRNVLVNEKGEVALADFGVSKILSRNSNTSPPGTEDGDGTAASSVGNIAGSPCFMAPEVIAGRTPDYKADVWSVGILALELANNGRVPHDELATPYRIMRAIQTSPPPTLDWTPQGDVAKGAAAAPPSMLVSPSTGTGGAAVPSTSATHPQAWSHQFHSFVRLCLATNPSQRSDAVSLLSHPFVSNSFSSAVMQPLIKAYEESERKRAKRAKKDSVIAAQQSHKADKTLKPSILDSLFKFLGRKGPTSVRAKIQVDALRSGGRLDEMGEDCPAFVADEAAGGSGGSASGGAGSDSLGQEQGGASDTVLISGGASSNGGGGGATFVGSDTVLMDASGGSDTVMFGAGEDEGDESDVLVDEMLGHGTVRTTQPTSSSASCSPAAPSASGVPSFPPASSHGSGGSSSSSSASHPPTHPPSGAGASGGLGHAPHHTHRKSLGDVLIKCTAGQLAALCTDIGIDSKLVQVLLVRASHKYGTGVPLPSSPAPTAATATTAATGSPGSIVRKSLQHTPVPVSRKSGQAQVASQHQRQQSPQPGSRAFSVSPAPSLDTSPDENVSGPPSSLSLFPGCPSSPAPGSEEYITQLEYSTVCVCGLSRSDLTSLKRMSNAPTPVRMAIESVAIVLGVKPHLVSGAVTRRSGERVRAVFDWWSPAQAVLVKANFLTLLKSYDFTQHLSPDIIDRLHEFALDKPASLTPQVVASCSMPAAILWNWTRSIYNYAVHCLGYKPMGSDPNAEPNALTLPLHPAPNDQTAANAATTSAAATGATGAASTTTTAATAESKDNLNGSAGSSNPAVALSSAPSKASLPLLAALAAPSTARMHRRGSAGTLDPAAALAASKHRRGTLGHGSQPQINVQAMTVSVPASASAAATAPAAASSSVAPPSVGSTVVPRTSRAIRRTSSGNGFSLGAALPPSGRSSPASVPAPVPGPGDSNAAGGQTVAAGGGSGSGSAANSAPPSPALTAVPTPSASPSPSVSLASTSASPAVPAPAGPGAICASRSASGSTKSSAADAPSATTVARRKTVGGGQAPAAERGATGAGGGAATARALSSKKPVTTAASRPTSAAAIGTSSGGSSTARTSVSGSSAVSAPSATKARTSLLPPAHAKPPKSS